MSLKAITKSSDFFSLCTFKNQNSLREDYNFRGKIQSCLNQKMTMRALVEFLYKECPLLWTGQSLQQLITHAAYYQTKDLLAECVRQGGQDILEAGNKFGETALFISEYSYRALKRLTDLGAAVNIKSTDDPSTYNPSRTVLESFLSYNTRDIRGHQVVRRCVKHLLGLGACIQENNPAHKDYEDALLSICQEFSNEIATVQKKMQMVAEMVFPMETLIIDYAIGEEDSETDPYDANRKCALDDEREAYQFIKKRNTVARKVSDVLHHTLEFFLHRPLRDRVLSYWHVSATMVFIHK